MTKLKKRKSLSQLHRDLDIAFSRYIRGRDCEGKQGYGICISCNHTITYHTSEAGHFIKRGKQNVRWDVRNVHAQCWECNRNPGQNIERDHREGLEIRIGATRLAELENDHENNPVPTRAEKEEMLAKFRSLAREYAV